VFGPYPNPFFEESRNTPLTLTCSDTRETVAPVLTSFNIVSPGLIDSQGIVREVVVEFAVTETGSGIEPSRTPTVYATETGFRSVSAKSELIGAGLYRATMKLPYSFGGFGGIYFSVYGLIDNHLNFNGYSTADLQAMGFGYYVQTTMSNTPHIQSAQFKMEDKGLTTLYGYNFGGESTNTVVEYSYDLEDESTYVSATQVEFRSNTGIVFRRPETSDPFKVRVTKNGVVSNVFSVIPTEPWLGSVAINSVVQKIILILNLSERPLLIQPNKLYFIIQLLTEIQTNVDITQLEPILQILKSRPTPQLQSILQLRQILLLQLNQVLI
ncbi:hypothetical protein CYY_009654, partial [Polysphondylium violaceum]